MSKIVFILFLLISCTHLHKQYSEDIGENLEIYSSVLYPHAYNQPMRDYLKSRSFKAQAKILEVGTGSGILSYIVAQKKPVSIIATDINKNAIKTVELNSKRLGFTMIHPVLVDKDANPYDVLTEKVDYIISNPPWFEGKAQKNLEHAYFDSEFKLLKELLTDISRHLNPDGEAIIEMGGKEGIEFSEMVLKTEHYKYEVVYQGQYGEYKKPYKIFRIYK